MSVHSCISKGTYPHPQIENFLQVKDHIFTLEHGKKVLLIRFANHMEYAIDAMEYTVVQLDSAGHVLAETKINQRGLRFGPGQVYATTQGLVVADNCADFRIRFHFATSGKYTYRVEGDVVTVHYGQEQERIVPNRTDGAPVEEFRVRTYRPRGRRLSVLYGILVVLILLAMCALGIFRQYFPKEQALRRTSDISVCINYDHQDR